MVEYKEIIRKDKKLKRIVLEYENYVEIINLEERINKQDAELRDVFENKEYKEYEELSEHEEFEEYEEYEEEENEGFYDNEGNFIKWDLLDYEE